jgi:LuxR family maltose regulon positive regulatory protein
MALDAQNRDKEALASLGEAVQLAKPGRWVRPFIEAGLPMSNLLKRLNVQNENLAFVKELRAAIGQYRQAPHSDEASVQGPQPLVDPLTKRELAVLSLLADGLSNKEIAGKLFLSPDTVKKHVYNTYQKLNVHNRVSAIEQVRRLGILAQD